MPSGLGEWVPCRCAAVKASFDVLADPFARRLLGLGAIFGTDLGEPLVQLGIAFSCGFGDDVPLETFDLVRRHPQSAHQHRGRGGSARSASSAAPPCAAARPRRAGPGGVPEPLNMAMAYSTVASTLPASAAACSSGTALSLSFASSAPSLRSPARIAPRDCRRPAGHCAARRPARLTSWRSDWPSR